MSDETRKDVRFPTPSYRLYLTANEVDYRRFLAIMDKEAPGNKAATLRKLMDHYESDHD